MATGPLMSIFYFILSYFILFSDTLCIGLCIQLQADFQCPVHSPHNVSVQMAYLIFQPLFIDGAQLFQQHYGIFIHIVAAGIQFNMRRQLRLVHL